MTQIERSCAPSGIALPFLLRKKRIARIGEIDEESSSSRQLETSVLGKRVCSADAIQDRAKRTALAMIDIQKQVYRGEETYYDDTNSHGNLFRGWDAFAFVDVGSSSSAPQPTNRRVPVDSRWFSSSCGSVQRKGRMILSSKGVSSNSAKAESALPTPASVGSASGGEKFVASGLS